MVDPPAEKRRCIQKASKAHSQASPISSVAMSEIEETPVQGSFTGSPAPTLKASITGSEPSTPKRSKRKANVSNLENLVQKMPLSTITSPVPKGLKELVAKLSKIEKFIGVISETEKTNMKTKPLDERFQAIVADYDSAFIADNIREAYGPCPSMKEVDRIVHFAAKCENDSDGEPSWNSAVHFQVMIAALHNDMYIGKVGAKDLSYAQIEPRSLLPQDASGITLGSRMIDFVVYLERDETIKALMNKHRSTRGLLNHTYHEAVRYNRIVISVETKVSGMDEQTALVQLCTWARAHLEKLKLLTAINRKDISGLEFLPMIMIQGHEWVLFAISDCTEDRPILWHRMTLGSTANIQSTYCLIAAVQTLAQWCMESYGPWFKENVLDGWVEAL